MEILLWRKTSCEENIKKNILKNKKQGEGKEKEEEREGDDKRFMRKKKKTEKN